MPAHLLPAVASKKRLKTRRKEESGLAVTVRELMEGEREAKSVLGESKPTVKEYTSSYAAHSHKSMFCRVCDFQAETKEELEAHWRTPAHKELARVEMKASFCNLCKKQFTSPAQLKVRARVRARVGVLRLEAIFSLRLVFYNGFILVESLDALHRPEHLS